MAETKFSFDDGASTIIESWNERGPTIACIHGMLSSRKAWVRLARHLDGKYRVIAYDQRGHGDAAAHPGPMRLERQVADLRAVLASLHVVPIALLGHSWGGAVAILGGRDADVRGVAAIDPVLRVPPGTFQAEYVDDAIAMAAMDPSERERFARTSYPWHPLDVEGKWHAIAQMTAEPIARLGSDNRVEEGEWDILGAVDAYPRPLLVFAARPDESVMSAEDLAHVRAHGGPNVRVSEHPGQGHNLHRTGFDAFAAELEDFLAKLPR